ncbi:hypothetical protein B0T21DRAFT_345632 [Apiosordaria backusii]|uniref:Uncharacterized protein n=1 Tax=Apiosordaria backusii TaxID=314023 RepID=A0AA40ELY0_9PEZI|nr:hypothetical protein B0T21DRAFT_345632 [Apiosordaria backusii]
MASTSELASAPASAAVVVAPAEGTPIAPDLDFEEQDRLAREKEAREVEARQKQEEADDDTRLVAVLRAAIQEEDAREARRAEQQRAVQHQALEHQYVQNQAEQHQSTQTRVFQNHQAAHHQDCHNQAAQHQNPQYQAVQQNAVQQSAPKVSKAPRVRKTEEEKREAKKIREREAYHRRKAQKAEAARQEQIRLQQEHSQQMLDRVSAIRQQQEDAHQAGLQSCGASTMADWQTDSNKRQAPSPAFGDLGQTAQPVPPAQSNPSAAPARAPGCTYMYFRFSSGNWYLVPSTPSPPINGRTTRAVPKHHKLGHMKSVSQSRIGVFEAFRKTVVGRSGNQDVSIPVGFSYCDWLGIEDNMANLEKARRYPRQLHPYIRGMDMA